MLDNHLKLAFRKLRKQRFFTFLNIAGLSVGITAALALFLYVQKENDFDRFHAQADRICRVNLTISDETSEQWACSPNITGPALTEALPEVKNYVRLLHHNFGRTASVAYGETRLKEELLFWADSTLLDVFALNVTLGDKNSALDRPNSVMLSESVAQKLFGNRVPIGEQLLIDNKIAAEVTAVYADLPGSSSWQMNMIGSFNSLGWAHNRMYWSNASFETFLLLDRADQMAGLDQKIAQVYNEAVAPENQWFSLWTQPFLDIHLRSGAVMGSYATRLGNAKQVRLIGWLALAVLLLACFNYVNLTTALSQQRLRETGISKTLGASTGQMIGRFLTETSLLTGISCIIAVGLLFLITPYLGTLTQRELSIGQLFTSGWAWSLPLLWLGVSLLAGFYPALSLALLTAKDLFQPNSKGKAGATYLRKVLVVGQFVVCIALISGALLLREQIAFLGQKKLGYDLDAVVALNLAGSKEEAGKKGLEQALQQLPGVLSTARAQSFPGIGTSGYSLSDPDNEQINHSVAANQIEPGTEELLGLKLLAGRYLPTRAESDTIMDVVLNEKMISLLNWTPEEAIGRPLENVFNQSARIVGVVEDFHFESLHYPITSYALHNGDLAATNFLLLRLEPQAVAGILPQLTQQFNKYLPEAAFDMVYLDQTVAQFYESEDRLSSLVTIFTILTIFISALGLLGLATFAAAQRTKEIGVRKVLGASVSGIVLLLSKDFLALVLVAVLFAVPLAWWSIGQWLDNYSYRIDIQWWVFALAAVLALGVALLTIAGQSWRAAVRNPVEALRSE